MVVHNLFMHVIKNLRILWFFAKKFSRTSFQLHPNKDEIIMKIPLVGKRKHRKFANFWLEMIWVLWQKNFKENSETLK